MSEEQGKKMNYWIFSTLLLAGVILGFGVSQFIPNLRGSETQTATLPRENNENQKKGGEGIVDIFERYARELGLETKQFRTCIENHTYKAEIAKDYADGRRAGVDGTPYFLINGEGFSGAQPFEIFQAAIEAAEKKVGPDFPSFVDDDPVMGDPKASVTIVEFSDFQCPFCRSFWQETFPLLEEQYIKTGKVKFIYRDFPLSSHREADEAAEAAECADEQGKFREMHDKIFENVREWSGTT